MKSEIENNLAHTLMKCIAACENCMTLCLQEADVAHMRNCINLQRDCIDICVITAKFMARSSSNTRRLLKECIEICRKCTEECSKHAEDHCQKCAEICQECFQACDKYLQRETAINSKWL